jgi:ribosomal protein S18 acetylase RimI-like enzyme
MRLLRPVTARDIDNVRQLFREYADSLDFDLDFQDFEDEMRCLPGDYAPPIGRLIVAMKVDEMVGCVALRRITDRICEMKRLYTKPYVRGTGVGRCLVRAIIDAAHRIGYEKMRLDTVPSMQAARRLYASVGFEEIEPYRYNPIGGATFMELDLTRCSQQGEDCLVLGLK